jgi:hypothetical protein
VVGVDLGQQSLLRRVALVVRGAVVRHIGVSPRIGLVAAFVGEGERDDAREVGLKGEHHHVNHQLGVGDRNRCWRMKYPLFSPCLNRRRPGAQHRRAAAGRRAGGALDAEFDFADGGEILVHLVPVGGA